jgi:Phosphotransferase enzyme family
VSDRAEHRAFVERRWPELGVRSFDRVDGGWDCWTYVVNGAWVFQFPRLPGAEDRLRKQISMLPELAREVSSTIPVPSHTSTGPVCMGYERIAGEPMSADIRGIWPERLGRFLYDLHLTPPEYLGLRSASPGTIRALMRDEIDALGAQVLPLLDPRERARAERTIAAFVADDDNFGFATCLTHGDVGPEHVLVTPDGDLAGVIDWGDLDVGDPVADLAWILHAMPEIGERVLGAYGGPPDGRFLDRAGFAFMLMPWHEVKHGVETGQPSFVESGLAGVRERLV